MFVGHGIDQSIDEARAHACSIASDCNGVLNTILRKSNILHLLEAHSDRQDKPPYSYKL
jgi:hypothetical protein